MRKHTHLFTSPHSKCRTKPKDCIHEVMIFRLLPWLSRNTWWFTCNGDPYRANIQPLSCCFFCFSFVFSIFHSSPLTNPDRLPGFCPQGVATLQHLILMQHGWTQNDWGFSVTASILQEVCPNSENFGSLIKYLSELTYKIFKSKKWRNHASRSCQLERGSWGIPLGPQR